MKIVILGLRAFLPCCAYYVVASPSIWNLLSLLLRDNIYNVAGDIFWYLHHRLLNAPHRKMTRKKIFVVSVKPSPYYFTKSARVWLLYLFFFIKYHRHHTTRVRGLTYLSHYYATMSHSAVLSHHTVFSYSRSTILIIVRGSLKLS